jgi:FlaG/FlaF family flagellin (archaellin)
MVAITVILAAVIGAFVLEIGNQQETAPNASFSSDQSVQYYEAFGENTNLSTVDVTHTGGETIAISQLNIKVNGNKSVWGPTGETTASGPLYRPQPDHFEAATTNEPVTVGSGDTWRVNAYSAWADKFVKQKEVKAPYYGYYTQGPAYGSYFQGCKERGTMGSYQNPSVKLSETLGGSVYNTVCTDRLTPGDDLQVVWHAQSGGKSQTLTKYRLQNDGAPGPTPP